MRTGGPYTIEVSFVGFHRAEITGIYIQLAGKHTYNVTLTPSANLDEVIVKSSKSKHSNGKTGAFT